MLFKTRLLQLMGFISSAFFLGPSLVEADQSSIITRDVIGGVVVGQQTGGTIIVENNGSQFKVVNGNRVKVLSPGEENIRHHCTALESSTIRKQLLGLDFVGVQLTDQQKRNEAKAVMKFIDRTFGEGPLLPPGALGYLGDFYFDGKGDVFRKQADGAFVPTTTYDKTTKTERRKQFKNSGIPNNYLFFIDYFYPDFDSIVMGPLKGKYSGAAIYVNFNGRLEAALKFELFAKQGSVDMSAVVALYQEMYQCAAFSGS